MSKGPAELKSKELAIKIVYLFKKLTEEKKEFVMSKQLLRCGTSVGANVSEGVKAQSKADFVSKMSIALKEVNETSYWLEILHETEYLDDVIFEDINNLVIELIRILSSIVKTSKESL